MDNQIQQQIIRQNKRDKVLQEQIDRMERNHNDMMMMLQHVSEQLADLRKVSKPRVKKTE